MKLGKKPAIADARDLRFAAYRAGKLPEHPRTFGHEKLVPELGMLGNDRYGDCAWAAPAHQEMLWNAEAGHEVAFSTEGVLSDYAAVTGFDPEDPDSDQGTVLRDMLKFWRSTGVQDASGARHKIGGFVALDAGNVDQLMEAAWLFGSVCIGVKMPRSASRQFDAGKPWSTVNGSAIEGGHCIPCVAVRGAGFLAPMADTLIADVVGAARDIVVVTWGRLQPMTLGFYQRYCDEAFAVLSEEMIGANGRTLEGFDLAALRADLAALGA